MDYSQIIKDVFNLHNSILAMAELEDKLWETEVELSHEIEDRDMQFQDREKEYRYISKHC